MAVYRFAYRLTGNQPDAEDVTQQTFLTAQQCMHQLRDQDNPAPWLLAIARSCWIKSHRRKRPTAAGAIELNVDDIAEPLPAVEEFDTERLQSALDELPAEFKLVVVMFYFQEQSYKEIAAALDIPMGTVMSRLARAKAHLRKRLAPPVEADPPRQELFSR
ncbi:MAG: sigma-70 family RNA polymerase sigma factor [Planctomycetales bacterium]|nr:sigma-70 family RNA polymerase sigma factor [Planctomycetales bacterium]